MAFAAHQFELTRKQKDGATLLEHYRAYEERNGQPHPSLADAPSLPDGLATLWSDFMDLHSSRSVGMGGAGPISYSDLDAWQRVTGNRLERWQIKAIRRADNAYFASRAKDG